MQALVIVWVALAAIWTGIYAAILYLTGLITSTVLYLPGFVVPVLILFAFWFIPAVYGGYIAASAISNRIGWT